MTLIDVNMNASSGGLPPLPPVMLCGLFNSTSKFSLTLLFFPFCQTLTLPVAADRVQRTADGINAWNEGGGRPELRASAARVLNVVVSISGGGLADIVVNERLKACDLLYIGNGFFVFVFVFVFCFLFFCFLSCLLCHSLCLKKQTHTNTL